MDPNQHDDETVERPGDLLVGADAIRAFLVPSVCPRTQTPILPQAQRLADRQHRRRRRKTDREQRRLSTTLDKIARGTAAA